MFLIIVAVTAILGGLLCHMAARLARLGGDKIAERVAYVQLGLVVSPLLLYPWVPHWYFYGVGWTVGAAGVSFALRRIWKFRRKHGYLPFPFKDEETESKK